MREKSSIERSIEGHEKAVVALYKDGSFYKEFESITKATYELGLRSKSAIGNVLAGRSKSSGGYLWIFKEDYNPQNEYSYNPKTNGIGVYQFDINGILIKTYPNKRFFDSVKGWSLNGLNAAIRNKTVYHDSYWSETDTINLDEYEQYFYYQEINESEEVVEMYRTQSDICKKFNMSPNSVLNYLRKGKKFPSGNIISKL